MATVTLIAPTGTTGVVVGGGGLGPYTINADGSVTVDSSMVGQLLTQGYQAFHAGTNRAWYIDAPIAAELVSIVAAVLPVSGTAFTIASQPASPRKLQVRCVQSGAVASLVVNLVGTDARGNAVTESISVAGASSATFITANAYMTLTSATPVGTVTNVTTIGIGVGAALALPGPAVLLDFTVLKEVVDVTNETVGTVDTVAGTVVPTTAANGTHNYTFFYQTSGG